MTGTGLGAPDRGGTAAPASLRSAVGAIVGVLAFGLAFRLIIAYLLPGAGFRNDLISFQGWASDLGENGPFGFYQRPFFHDYTPGYLYALWAVGLVGRVLGGIGDLVKLPAIIGDVALAVVVHSMVRELGGSPWRARVAAFVVVVNPITWFDSVVWGQVDSVGVVFLMLAVRELWRGRSERSAVLAVVAALIKPQLGIVIPIIAAVTIRRALRPTGGWGDDPQPQPSGIGLERRVRGPVRIVTTALAAVVTTFALCIPFGLSVIQLTPSAPYVDSGLARQILSTAAGYPYVTVNADNPWALVSVDHGGSTWGLTNGTWVCDALGPVTRPGADPAPCAADQDPAVASVLGIPPVVVGSIALLAVVALVTYVVARKPDKRTILVGLAVLALAFFVLPTRVHERYLFPFVAIGVVLAAVSSRWVAAYVAVSVASFLNMYVVLTTIYPDNPQIADWLGIGPGIRSATGVTAIAITISVAFLWSLTQLRDSARQRLAVEIAAAARSRYDEDEAERVGGPAGRGPTGWSRFPGAEAGLGTSMAAATGDEQRYGSPDFASSGGLAADAVLTPGSLVPAWLDRTSSVIAGPVGWLRERFDETPIRPDRSRLLTGERGGRLDRVDLWLLLVLVVASLVLRTFRLSEPLKMHFDEVYHARTATEFLQVWRYGIDHDIYEWTHPHLAKYAMAAGIVAFAPQDVAGTTDLGVPVRDAAIEPRREAVGQTSAGDRLWVATGGELVAFDLDTRAVVGRWSIPGASTVAIDGENGRVVAGTDAGKLVTLDTSKVGSTPADTLASLAPAPLAAVGGAPERLIVPAHGDTAVALVHGGDVVTVDLSTGDVLGRAAVKGATDLANGGSGQSVVATIADVTDRSAAARSLASILGGDAAGYEDKLAASGTDRVNVTNAISSDQKTKLDAAVSEGNLPGIEVAQDDRVAVAGTSGVTFLDHDGAVVDEVAIPGGASAVGLVTGVEEYGELYVGTHDDAGKPQLSIIAVSGERAASGPVTTKTFQVPGAVSRITYDPATQMVHYLGATPDGQGTTEYVLESHARATFADNKLPFAPSAWVLDTAPDYPSADRSAILAFSPSGTAATADVGHYEFAWRLPGVLAGAATLGLLYLLTRILFARRSVAVLVGLFVLLDGMFFVQSRIAMNDVYVGLFIVAAYVIFAALWTGWTKARAAFWVGFPVIGLLLGLALASKWVAAYAIGALGILILARSALGRVLLIAGLIGLTAVLGWMALSVTDGNGFGNLTFVIIMIALTLAAVVVAVLHPIAWSAEEIRFAVGAPAVAGIVLFLGALATGRTTAVATVRSFAITPAEIGLLFILVAVGIAVAFGVAGRLGIGPLAPPASSGDPAAALEPPAPAAEGWLRLGSGMGLPAIWLIVCLLAIPLGVYVVSYIPWAFIDSHQLLPNWPPGHTGQTLVALTGDMYRYHNDLTAAHAASSPWWAWPLNLKPVWFYQDGFADATAGSIYDAGNLLIWWLGIPAMVFAAVMAFRRRSLALALIVVGFLCQWVSWARIDRAAFQYHYYTSLPFVVLALGYFVGELWHGASRRTWLVAKIGAAIALLGPVILWLLRTPLCGFVRVDAVNPGSQACTGAPANLEVSPQAAATAIVGIVFVVVLVRLLGDLGDESGRGPRHPTRLVPLGLTVVGAFVALLVASSLPATGSIVAISGIVPEAAAIPIGLLLVLVAAQVVAARDARRFVVGFVAAVAAWFAILYPNISALQLPTTIVNAYQGLLPTYLYAFQFPVTTQHTGAGSFSDPRFFVLGLSVFIACVVIGYTVWVWRVGIAERRLGGPGDGDGLVSAGEA
ncbi:MAG: phospholipid carrier-dependent glycosyltransferase [Chloroflexota bacterium]